MPFVSAPTETFGDSVGLSNTIEMTTPLIKIYPNHPSIRIARPDRVQLQHYFDVISRNNIGGKGFFMEDPLSDMGCFPNEYTVLPDEKEFADALSVGVIKRSNSEFCKASG